MEHVHTCTDKLRSLIHAGATDSMPHAEKAIDDMLAAAPADQHKDSLGHLRSAIEAHCESVFAPHQLHFADAINDYIERLMTRFE
jgi:hypothetical protein